MKMIVVLSGAAIIGGLCAVPAVTAEGVVFAGTVVGESLLGYQSIEQNAEAEHEAAMMGISSPITVLFLSLK